MLSWLILKRGNSTQKQIADLVGITQQQLSNIETEKKKPSVNTAKKIADILKFNWTIFFDDKEAS